MHFKWLWLHLQHGSILLGETDAAKAMLTHCLEQDSTFSDAHLLMAQVVNIDVYFVIWFGPGKTAWTQLKQHNFCCLQIHLQQGNYKLAEQSLEVGLSYNFEVSDKFCQGVLYFSINTKRLTYQIRELLHTIDFVGLYLLIPF